jgi:predicted RNA polymerase sigma factor
VSSSRSYAAAVHLHAVVLVLFMSAAAGAQSTDWANLQKYREANAKLSPPVKSENRVVFLGNSITEGWAPYFAAMFPG